MGKRNAFGKAISERFRATVINDIWVEVTFFTLVATMVSLVSEKTSHSLAVSNQLLTVLGTVLGLVISFRTSSAYERYQEGRKLWTNLGISSRNLAQMIWIHVPTERESKKAGAAAPAAASSAASGVDDGRESKSKLLAAVIEKKTIVNLIQAFSVSVKHMLRAEPGIYYEDLYPLVCFLPRFASSTPEDTDDLLPLWQASEATKEPVSAANNAYHHHHHHHARFRSRSDPGDRAPLSQLQAQGQPSQTRPPAQPQTQPQPQGAAGGSDRGREWKQAFARRTHTREDTFDPEKVLPDLDPAGVYLRPARNPPRGSAYDYAPFLRVFKPVLGALRGVSEPMNEGGTRTVSGHKKSPAHSDSNVPLEILLYLSSYLAWILKEGLLTPALATGILNNMTSLQDSARNLKRIRDAPLPFAYQAHLRMTLWLYLIFLPFQIYTYFKYLTIPFTAFTSFLLLGFLEIGQEIENPFMYFANDLDLDGFVLSIERDLNEITAHTSPTPASYIFTANNQCFAPADRRSAAEMMAGDDAAHAYHASGAPGAASVQRTLLKSWREVDTTTRHHYWHATTQSL